MAQTDSTLDYRLLGPCLFIVATSYGLARYAYGLFIPIFRESLGVGDAALAFIAAVSYASYFLITIAGIYLLRKISPRTSVVLGGLSATVGMACVATAKDATMLTVGVMIAGVSPGLAYTPIADIVARHVSLARQHRVYSIINSGTSLGVMMSGPIAMLYGAEWRAAWGWFAAFGLVSTAWCASVIPGGGPLAHNGDRPIAHTALLTVRGVYVLTLSFLIGIATSVYWTFAVDLVATGLGATVAGLADQRQVSQMFWTLVGVAGFVGVFAGAIVDRLGAPRSLTLFLLAIALATLGLANAQGLVMAILSALVFGAFFVLMAATLGMWSMDVFVGRSATGFGLTFLLLSLGQFEGPFLVGLFIGQVSLSTIFVISGALSGLLALMLVARAPPNAFFPGPA